MDLLGSGREADVYAIDERRVLRRYRRGDDATAEAELMTYLAGHGYPVPHVHSASGADLVLERLDGPTMTEAFAAGRLGVDDGAAILADLHDRLHRLPSRSGRAGILHRDLHPENVMLASRGPVVIDWHNAAEGRPAVDVCLTAIIMAQVAVDPSHPHVDAATAFLGAFLARVGGEPLDGLDEALDIRRADPALTATEAAGLAAAVTPLIRDAAAVTPLFRDAAAVTPLFRDAAAVTPLIRDAAAVTPSIRDAAPPGPPPV
ncbi:phosphotransferase [Actinoplanes sichuanensis]|uniref:Phosphotransferase n=1 Tax=Actinoplanes sichuanensis TaxID=512349 RepID=A0ABW4ANS5_9ACTN|nr:phosphotransferase [Actinoplanes sichuanensis]BEL08248.1 phosphotransferase [Actinoplanes sichuanensis]